MHAKPTGLSVSRARWPNEVLVLGGGRWARVIADVLCGLLPPDHALSLYSPHCTSQLQRWLKDRQPATRVRVHGNPPQIGGTTPPAVIVVNAARDHLDSARWALSRGAAVLVEKPMSLAVAPLVDLATQYAPTRQLFAAHVFRFASYLENFRDRLAAAGTIHSIAVEWLDPLGESRYGEHKQYDSSVPVLHDCLPHVVSILHTLTGCYPMAAGPISAEEGGARIALSLTIGARPCKVLIARRAARRVRQVWAETDQGPLSLDFATEPGVIRSGAHQTCAAPNWATEPRPLASMLTAFLHAAGGDTPDPRLDTDMAIQTCRLTEDYDEAYRSAVTEAAAGALLGTADLPAGDYALAEFFQAKGRMQPNALSDCIAHWRETLRGQTPALATQTLTEFNAGLGMRQGAALPNASFLRDSP